MLCWYGFILYLHMIQDTKTILFGDLPYYELSQAVIGKRIFKRDKIDITSDIECTSEQAPLLLLLLCRPFYSFSRRPSRVRRRLRLRIKSWNWIFLIIPFSLPFLPLPSREPCLPARLRDFQLNTHETSAESRPLHPLPSPPSTCELCHLWRSSSPFIPDFVAALLSELELETLNFRGGE